MKPQGQARLRSLRDKCATPRQARLRYATPRQARQYVDNLLELHRLQGVLLRHLKNEI